LRLPAQFDGVIKVFVTRTIETAAPAQTMALRESRNFGEVFMALKWGLRRMHRSRARNRTWRGSRYGGASAAHGKSVVAGSRRKKAQHLLASATLPL
jgi:hypothetical protein